MIVSHFISQEILSPYNGAGFYLRKFDAHIWQWFDVSDNRMPIYGSSASKRSYLLAIAPPLHHLLSAAPLLISPVNK